MRRFHTNLPSPALAVAFIALVLALGGTAAAKFGPFKGDKIIKKHLLAANRLKDHTITATQINLGSLGKVPSTVNADNATNATNLGGLPGSAYQSKTRWALVKGNAQSGGISVFRNSAGAYYLNFGSSIASRPIAATLRYALKARSARRHAEAPERRAASIAPQAPTTPTTSSCLREASATRLRMLTSTSPWNRRRRRKSGLSSRRAASPPHAGWRPRRQASSAPARAAACCG